VVIPGSLTIGHYQVSAAAELVETLTVFPERMRAAVEHTNGLVYSSIVLADLLAGGYEREKAYRVVQAAADQCAASDVDFRAALEIAGIEVGELTPERFLANHDVVLKRLEELGELED
jgi:adenylosuccinate lyase